MILSISARSSADSFQLAGFDVLLDLLGLGRAGDDAGDRRAGQQPGEGEFQRRVAARLGEVDQLLGLLPVLARSDSGRPGAACLVSRASAGIGMLRRYLPVSSPLASGKYGSRPSP